MRYLYIAVAVVFIFGGDIVTPSMAADNGGSGDTAKSVPTDVVQKKAPLADDQEFGEDNRREMPQQENYDENTGLPNVVDSDKNGEM